MRGMRPWLSRARHQAAGTHARRNCRPQCTENRVQAQASASGRCIGCSSEAAASRPPSLRLAICWLSYIVQGRHLSWAGGAVWLVGLR